MIRHRFKTEQEMKSEWNDLTEDQRDGNFNWRDYFYWDNDEQHRFIAGKHISTDDYEDIADNCSFTDYIEDLPSYYKWEAEFGRPFDFWIGEIMIVTERYNDLKSHKGVNIGDAIFYDGIACKIIGIYKEDNGAEFEFMHKGVKKYMKSKVARIIKKRILNKVK